MSALLNGDESGRENRMEKMRNIKLGQDGKGSGTFEGVRNTDMEDWMGTKTSIVG